MVFMLSRIKIPTILSACHNVIYQAMQLSVFNEINAEDKSMYFKRLYKTYSFLMTFVCSILILLDKVIAKFLFRGDFYVAWKYSPALLISMLFIQLPGIYYDNSGCGKRNESNCKIYCARCGNKYIF